jgi:hypothetical protein
VRVLVCGSRDWTDEATIADELAEFAHEPERVEVIHGAARGADMMAARVASVYGYDVRGFPADWDRYGKRAGFLRNIEMLDAQPDLVLAFQRNRSRGTQHTIDEARKRGIPVAVISR